MAREDMHMHVEYLLTGSLAVCEVDVDSFAPKLGRPQCGCGELSYSEQRRSVFSVQIREGSSVTTRHDDHVSTDRRLDVHEGDRSLVLMDDADL